MAVRIGQKHWDFQQVNGRQILNGQEFESICHHRQDGGLVTVSNTVPIDRQLELVAEAVAELADNEATGATPAMEDILDEQGIEYDYSRVGVPTLKNVRWQPTPRVNPERDHGA